MNEHHQHTVNTDILGFGELDECSGCRFVDSELSEIIVHWLLLSAVGEFLGDILLQDESVCCSSYQEWNCSIRQRQLIAIEIINNLF